MSKLRMFGLFWVMFAVLIISTRQSSAQIDEIHAQVKWSLDLDGRGLVVWHPSENILAVSSDENIYIFDGETGEILNNWQAHEWNPIVDIVWHPNGEWLTTVDDYVGNFTTWDSMTGEAISSFIIPNTSSFSWNPETAQLATANDGEIIDTYAKSRDITVWNISGTIINEEYLLWSGESSNEVEYSPDGKYLAGILNWWVTPIYVWDTKTYDLKYSLLDSEFHTLSDQHFAQSIAWSPDSQKLAVILNNNLEDENGVGIWDLEEDTFERYILHTAFVNAIAWHPSENWLLTAGGDGFIGIWDISTFNSIVQVDEYFSISVDWNYDGSYFAASNTHNITVWEIVRE